MASAAYTNLRGYTAPIPRLSPTSLFPLFFHPSHASGLDGVSRVRLISNSGTHAKFEKFEGQEDPEYNNGPQQEPFQQVEETEEDDRCSLIWC